MGLKNLFSKHTNNQSITQMKNKQTANNQGISKIEKNLTTLLVRDLDSLRGGYKLFVIDYYIVLFRYFNSLQSSTSCNILIC